VPRISETYRLARLFTGATRDRRASAANSARTIAQIIEITDSSKVMITPREMNGHHSAINAVSIVSVRMVIGPMVSRRPLNSSTRQSSQKASQSANETRKGMCRRRRTVGAGSS
jgi:hypothetical protein